MKTTARIVAIGVSIALLVAVAADAQSLLDRQRVVRRSALQGKIAGDQETAAGGATDSKGARTVAPATLIEETIDPATYVLGPGDQLAVSFMGPEPRVIDIAVLPEGDVFIPDIGAIHADGLTLERFRAVLAETIGRSFRNIEVFCYLVAPARFRVFVTGDVNRPGAVDASSVERVTDAIEKAGGVAIGGSRRLVTLERGGEKIYVDLQRFVHQGDFADNPHLRGGDRVHVPPAGATAVIYGEVHRPGYIEIRDGETVADLIDLAGGFTSDALRDSAVFARVQPNGSVRSTTIPAARFDERLVDKDEIGIFSRFKYRKLVHVEGAIQRTGRVYLAENEGLTELIVRAGGFTPDADLASAYVNKKDGRVIQVNLRDYLPPNASKNLLLDDGDVIAIPRVPTTVTVGGEVNAPGEFEYMGDLTIVQYIGLAGGPTKDGSVDRVVVYRSDGSARDVSRDDLPGRGDVIVVKRSYARVLGDVFRGVLSAGTLIVSILILSNN